MSPITRCLPFLGTAALMVMLAAPAAADTPPVTPPPATVSAAPTPAPPPRTPVPAPTRVEVTDPASAPAAVGTGQVSPVPVGAPETGGGSTAAPVAPLLAGGVLVLGVAGAAGVYARSRAGRRR